MVATQRAVAVAFAALLACSLAVAPAAASPVEQNAEPSLVVELRPDGDADVTLTMTYDLTSDDERDAFESLKNDERAQQNATERYADRLGRVAENANDGVDREMRVPADGASIALQERGDVGVVRLSATWTNLAAVEGDRLVVTEPFASGYEPDRPVAIVAPDGHEVASATPSADAESDGRATWDAGTSLDGFEATIEPAEDGDSLPGFGIGAALLSVLGTLSLALRRGR